MPTESALGVYTTGFWRWRIGGLMDGGWFFSPLLWNWDDNFGRLYPQKETVINLSPQEYTLSAQWDKEWYIWSWSLTKQVFHTFGA